MHTAVKEWEGAETQRLLQPGGGTLPPGDTPNTCASPRAAQPHPSEGCRARSERRVAQYPAQCWGSGWRHPGCNSGGSSISICSSIHNLRSLKGSREPPRALQSYRWSEGPRPHKDTQPPAACEAFWNLNMCFSLLDIAGVCRVLGYLIPWLSRQSFHQLGVQVQVTPEAHNLMRPQRGRRKHIRAHVAFP